MASIRPAEVHGLRGVEIEVNEWEPGSGWKWGTWTVYARLAKTSVQWLATVDTLQDGTRRLRTFLDEGFEDDWGEVPRRLESREEAGRSETAGSASAVSTGVYRIMIGENSFRCLRVLDFGTAAAEDGTLVEGYITEKDRTVLWRRYNGRKWGVPQHY